MQKAAKAYFATQVGTTSQGQLLLMLYDGCIKFLHQAKAKIEEKDYAQKGILLSKALDVINELDGSLNAEKGGDLAENLHKLYFYCSTRLLNANLKMDISYIDEVIKILEGLRSAYAQIVNTPEAAAAAAMTTPAKTGQTNFQHAPPAGGMIPKPSSFGGNGAGLPKPAAYGAKQPMQPAPQPNETTQQAPAAQQNQQAMQPPTQQTTGAENAEPKAQPTPQAPPIPQPLNLSGKRVTGAAMYRKMAANNSPT